jgi:uracil-DNA glycosylase
MRNGSENRIASRPRDNIVNALKTPAILHYPPEQPQVSASFDVACRRCARLANFLDKVKAENVDYWCKPVPPFGAGDARLLLIGLAPGMHGANRTGRPFTGDYAGELLYSTLHAYGFATGPISISADDGLTLRNCRISNAVKCLPPANKPTPAEIKTCNEFLRIELALPNSPQILLALGRIAHDAVLMAFGYKANVAKFGHGARHTLPNGFVLYDSYHCSRYNTQTKRLTPQMFHDVFARIRAELDT